jgi:hypothetical protein
MDYSLKNFIISFTIPILPVITPISVTPIIIININIINDNGIIQINSLIFMFFEINISKVNNPQLKVKFFY